MIHTIYTPYGHKVRRKVGFCADSPFEVVICSDKGEESGCVDLIGSSISYWSETEERMMDKNKQDGHQTKGKD